VSLSSPASSEAAQLTRARIQQAMSSPSGKLTISPEIFVPEPSSPTAILLQGPAVTQLSTAIRVKAKANIAFVAADSFGSYRTFCKEQEEARGNFPGPVPVIYCATENNGISKLLEDMTEVSETGVSGVLVSVNEGSEISSVDDISEDGETSWLKLCKTALECGLQPIPEITLKDLTATTWKEEEMEALVSKLSELMGEDPVSILITINSSSNKEDESGDEEETSEPAETLPLPVVPKALGKRVPILASVREGAGAGRLGQETARIKASGFTGAVLRRKCVPGFPANPPLEFSSDFWSACIGDLKSTRSKSFNFRSKNNMETHIATKWADYQSDVMDSGALGDMADSAPPGFDPDSGDYQGF
jgi:hypothetical protein